MPTITVRQAGGGDYASISDAVAAAAPGDTIVVGAGDYAENVIIDKSLTLVSESGRDATTITGSATLPGQGAIEVAAGVNNVTIGGVGQGFTVIGFDGTPGIERAAIYLTGAHDGITIQGNDVVANGDLGLVSEFNAPITNALIDSNVFSGTSFTGAPGIGNQFTVPNVPRPLVFLGTNDGSVDSSNITFTNNEITGTAGGLTSGNQPSGNTLVNIDAKNSTISGNEFTGYTIGNGTQLRSREENTTITNNEFSNNDGGNIGAFVQNDGQPGNVSGNSLDYGAGDDRIFASAGNDDIDGGIGTDTYDMTAAGSSGSFVDLGSGLSFSSATGVDTLQNIENVKGSSGADGLYGDVENNLFEATAGSDVIDGRDGVDTFDASSATTAVIVNLTTGASSGAFTATLTSIENATGGAGDDSFTGSSAANVFRGGAGTDTANYAATPYADAEFGWDASAGGFTIATPGGATDTLIDVEKAQVGGVEVFLVDSAAELTAALTQAGSGDVIKLGSGTYEGSFTIANDGVTIESATGVAGDVVLKGTFKSANGIADGDSVATWLQTRTQAQGYQAGTNATGLTVSADDVTIRDITLSSYQTGINVGSNDGLTLDGVALDGFVTGVNKSTQAVVTDFTWTGGSVTDGHHGATFNASAGEEGEFSNVLIQGVSFSNLNEKGLYFEQLDSAQLLDLVMNDVGQYGRVPTLGGNGTFGAGIDINLKYEAYADIEIARFDFTDVGLSNGAGSPHAFGGAILVKARDDGPAYDAPDTASLNGVEIHDGTISGTSTGIRIGEPGKNNFGPEGVTVTGVVIDGAVVASYDNQSQSLLDVTLTAGDDTVVTSPTSVGPISYGGLGGDDTYVIQGDETIVEAVDGGVDTVVTGGGYTLGDNVENLTLVDVGSDTQNFENFDVGPITNGENGWTLVDIGSDQGVVDLGGNKVFKMSSDPSSTSFAGPFSPDFGPAAGENATTAEGDVHVLKFRLKPVSDTADSSRLEVDFGNEAGNDRNNFMIIENYAGGVRIAAVAPAANGSFPAAGGTAPNDYLMQTVASGLDPAEWHDIELRLTYEDGANNDVIEIYVDGVLVGLSSTFENFRDALGTSPGHGANAEANQTNRIFFRPSANGSPQDGPGGSLNQGFYFDDITNSVISTGTGNALGNVITGGDGSNELAGLGGNDTLNGQDGDDVLTGGEGVDELNGGDGDDVIVESLGEGVADEIDGGDGVDTLLINGSAADDTASVTTTGGVIDDTGETIQNVENVALDLGGQGTGGDTLSYEGTTEGVTVDLGAGTATGFSSVEGVENVVGGSGADAITGDAGANVLSGAGDNDTLTGGLGADTLIGGEGDDLLEGGAGIDSLLGGAGSDRTAFDFASDGADQVDLGADLDRVDVSAGTATQVRVTFTSADVGNGAALDGNNAANEDGGLAVRLQAEDVLGVPAGTIGRFDDEGVTFVAASGLTFDVRDLPSTTARGDQFSSVTLGSSAGEALTGIGAVGADNYYVNAGQGNDTVTGADGNDFLVGGGGDDTLIGGIGADSFIGGGGADAITGGIGDDLAILNVTTDGADAIDLGDGADLVNVSATTATQVRLTFTSGDVGNGAALDGANNTNEDGGLAVRVQAENGADGVTGAVTRVDDEGVTFVAQAGVTFDVRNLTDGVARGDAFTTATLGTNLVETIIGTNGADYVNAGQGADIVSGGVGNDFLVGGAGNDQLDGGANDDQFIGGGGSDAIEGGAGIDAAIGYAAGSTLTIVDGNWTVTTGTDVDTLANVERVTIGTTNYILVDEEADGGFGSVQAAIGAALGNETILIAPGTYTESGSNPALQGGNQFGLYVNTANLTLQGVRSDGSFITTAAEAATIGATVIAGNQAGFGANHFVDVGGTNLTIAGLHLQAGPATNNKLLEIWADGATVTDSFIDVNVGGSAYSGAIAVFFNENVVDIESYVISDNILNEGVGVYNGTGDPGDAEDQIITGNIFRDTFDPVTGEGRYDTFALQGQVVGTGFNFLPIGYPTITGNTLEGNATPFILRLASDDPDNFPDAEYIEQVLADNTTADTTYAYVLQSNGELRLAPRDNDGPGVAPATNNYFVTNSIETLNLALDTTADTVFGAGPGAQRINQVSGDTIVVQSGSEAVSSRIMVNGLTVQATENSADLNLTLSATLADGTPTTVATLTLADYATGQGADVDVMGNALANTITGNSGNNVLDGSGGNDSLEGGAGSDLIRGGAGTGDRAVYDGEYSDYTVTQTQNGNFIVTDNDTGDVDIVSGVEFFEFDGNVVAAANVLPQAPVIQSVLDAGDGTATITVAENSANGTAVAVATAIDANAAAGDTVSYSLVNANGSPYTGGQFAIDATTGQITVAGALDHEATPSVGLIVRATDESGLFDDQAVTVNVTDVNEAPTAIALDNTSVFEANDGEIVGVLSVTDPDGDTSFGFTIDDARFEVVQAAGEYLLQLKDGEAFDFEGEPSVTINVTATDGGGLSFTEEFTLDVEDVNEAPTGISLDNNTVDEGEDGAPVGLLTVDDPDAGDTVEFTVDDPRFEVVAVGGSFLLKLKDDVQLDFENAPGGVTISVAVTATDSGMEDFVQSFTITVNDVDEAPGGTATQSVEMEQGATDAPLGIVGLVDPEGETLTYTVTTLPTAGSVRLAGVAITANQALTAAQVAALTYTAPDDQADPFTLQFSVSDGLNSTPLTVTLDVQDGVSAVYSGTDAADRLDGAFGNDTVRGLGGNDTLLGGSGVDQLYAGGGADSVDGGSGFDYVRYDDGDFGAITISLTDQSQNTGAAAGDVYTSVEGVYAGVGNDIVIGDAAANVLIGLNGNDALYGGLGADVLNGGAGIDYARYDDANYGDLRISLASTGGNTGAAQGDSFVAIEGIIAGVGNDVVGGNDAVNYLYGGGGNDTIVGNGGNDLLSGGAGQDVFVFTKAPDTATNNDRIIDFNVANDTIQLNKTGFSKLFQSGTLNADLFHVGGAAGDANDRIIYDNTNGKLFYDEDGTGAITAKQFATVTIGLALTNADFVVG